MKYNVKESIDDERYNAIITLLLEFINDKAATYYFHP